MTDRRLQLHDTFLAFCPNVYFQPPENIKLVYPCIIYEPDDESRTHANNGIYSLKDEYQVTIIDRDPDSAIRQAVRMIPMSSFSRFYATEGLNHFIYTLYF